MFHMYGIEVFQSQWALPASLVAKKDDTLHFCVYYRNFNCLGIQDMYLIPHMDECIDSLGNATIF